MTVELPGKGGGTGEGSAATKRAKPRPEPKYLMIRLERDSHICKLLIALAKQSYRTPQDLVAFLIAEAAKPRPAAAVTVAPPTMESDHYGTTGTHIPPRPAASSGSAFGIPYSSAFVDWSTR